ncbi:hypothetical protein [Stenotrophomonas bentonitica]|uniref:hypothetical protein n=1 Tax=Stenotrophomonas bentonitica TaxID=1450134 RepID=UPI00345EE28E
MDMPVLSGDEAQGRAEVESLTFSWLYGQVQSYADQGIYPKPSRLEKTALWVGVGATGAGLLIAALPSTLIPVAGQIVILKACLLVEVLGFLLSFALMLKREGRQYIKPRQTHAAEMDGDFDYWVDLVARLREFPRQQREQRLRFANNLRLSMTDRMGLMYGGMQKLGPFPILVAFYLQFRNWKWGDWAAAFDVNLVSGILIASMVLLYALGWMLMGMRIRLDTYVSLLEASLADLANGEEVLRR